MAFEKKTWTDRLVEFANRRILTDTSGGTATYTVARSEGVVMNEGDPFNAETMNNMEQRIADAFEADATEISAKLDKSSFSFNSSTGVLTLTL